MIIWEMIALRKEAFNLMVKESKYIGIAFLLALAAFKIAFFKENFFTLIRTVASLFWLFVIPGYFIMIYWHDRVGFMERLVIGIFATTGIIGISSYYLGVFGLHIRYHTILLPSILILIGLAVNLRNSSKPHSQL